MYRGREYEVSLLAEDGNRGGGARRARRRSHQSDYRRGRTGEIGNSRVFVIPVEQGYNIRTGEKDV